MAKKKKTVNKKTGLNVKNLEADARATAKKEIAKAKLKLAIAEKKLMGYAKKDPKKALIVAGAIGAAVGAGIVVAMNRLQKK